METRKESRDRGYIQILFKTPIFAEIEGKAGTQLLANKKFPLRDSKRSQRIRNFYPNFIQTREMLEMEEEKPLTKERRKKEKKEDSLLNYEYDEDDDGVDWET